MKKKSWLEALSLADSKYIMEADPEAAVSGRKRHVFGLIAACLACVIAIGSLILFMPFNTDPPDVSEYAGSEYYTLIRKLNELTYDKPEYKNNFDMLMSNIGGAIKESVTDRFTDMNTGLGEPEAGADAETDGTGYQEITDNQVGGVIEADRIKRSDRYIYYLDGDTLRVYTIAGSESEAVGTYILTEDSMLSAYLNEWEFYLSSDCTTVTVIAPYYNQYKKACVSVIALDVTDPANMTKKNTMTVTGSYVSSRLTDGSLLLLSEYSVYEDDIDFADETTFLPQIDSGNGLEPIPADGIISPETLTDTRYTVVLKLDENTLAVDGSAAFLSYSQEVYVSKEDIFATRGFSDTVTDDSGYTVSKSMTEISRLSYAGDSFVHKGSVTVEGYVKDQYSLDVYEGILRVVTTTNVNRYKTRIFGNETVSSAVFEDWNTGTNANLYCVSLSDWSIAAQVLQFAPAGEIVQSVRFDGDAAYVCTSVQLSDPVFFFDLSDLNNITWKDTGTIEGFSSSLINFGSGYLLGIGRGSSWSSLKIEVYRETQNGVESVCKYELDRTEYSEEYKAYYIDRENQLLGLGIRTNGAADTAYILLLFDGYELHKLLNEPLYGDPAHMRGVYIDGCFYMFGANGKFSVKPVL